MTEKPVRKIRLENDLLVEVRDLSRIIAGDRWLVSLEAEADIPLREEYFEGLPERERVIPVLEKAIGQRIPFRYTRNKHFVDRREKEEVFNRLLETFINSVLPYLKHPDFARRFVLSRYQELKRRDPRSFSGS